MKKIIKIAVLGAVILTGSSCKKFLDVNTNPNNPTNSTPNIVLPAAILTSATSIDSYDNFGAWAGGYKANAGGYGGFGTEMTYLYTTSSYNAMWTSAFSGINQLNFVISNTDATGKLKYYNAMARIMKSFLYQRLVDQYGDVPYSDAGQGTAKLNPKYDSYIDVYKAVYAELDAAIAILNSTFTANTFTPVTAAQDPLFGGSGSITALDAAKINRWKQLANTIKLKMVVRTRNVAAFSSWRTAAIATLPTTSAGYLSDDAIVNPGFNASNASQFNSKWSSYGWTSTGASTNLSHLPTPWILSFYNGTKISDNVRGKAIYASYGVTVNQTIGQQPISFVGPATNQLGYVIEPVKRSQAGSFWYSGIGRSSRPTGTTANAATDVGGVLKGATAGQPIFLAAESYFLQSEAALASVNIVPGNAEDLYKKGVAASFTYLYKNATNTYFNTTPATTLVDNYIADNSTNKTVNFSLAANDEERLEAIITQKYIAVNFIMSDEGFNEFRRTGYPRIVLGSTDPVLSFASLQSTNSLPDRVLYPAVEFQVNSSNVPKGITSKTKLFYAK